MNSTQQPERLKYVALADRLRSAIERGDYAHDGTFPTARELRQIHRATNDTVKSALQILLREGLIDTGQGRRTRVVPRRPVIHRSASYLVPAPDGSAMTWTKSLAEAGMTGTQILGRVGEVPVPADVAQYLGLEPGSPVICRPRVMLADGEPVETADSYYLRELASGTALAQQGLVKGGAYAVFSAQGMPLVDREEIISFGPSADCDRERLAVPASAWVIRMAVVHRTEGGRPISVDLAVLRADRHQLRYTVPVHG